MSKTCTNPWCSNSFEVLPEDLELLKKFDCPEPEQCPTCRHLHRGSFKESLHFYHRPSDLSGKEMITVFGPEVPFPVYSIEEWWSDEWNAFEYGIDFDFSKEFFPQYIEMYNRVPKVANFITKSENSDYCSSAGHAKNAYYCCTAHRGENLFYCEYVTGHNNDLCDCLVCQGSDNLYECMLSFGCHSSSYLLYCNNTDVSHFCFDCNGCNNCMFCWNLRQKSYHVFNEPVSKEEYEKIKSEYISGKHSDKLKGIEKWHETMSKAIRKDLSQVNCDNCHGDNLINCSNCYECYNCLNTEDSRYCWGTTPSEKCISNMDITTGGIGELLYNCISIGSHNYFLRMCCKCRSSDHCTYCSDCYNCKHCFGCTGLKQKEYCIFNKQYSKEEYEELQPKMIEYMKKTGEWGKFFPKEMERFAYNESFSMLVEPLSKEEVLRRGWKWKDKVDEPLEVEKTIPAEKLPDDIQDVPDDALNWAIVCEESKRPFRLIQPELKFYRRMNIPIPREHPDVRMDRRRKMRNPLRLWGRKCAKCQKGIQTTYSPDRPEIVYCERCYLEEVY